MSHERDWVSLFDHLLKQAGWCHDSSSARYKQIQEVVFGGELINATILLLQSLTPVRVGLLDGQARAIALYYYLLKLAPSMDGKVVPLTDVVTESHAHKHWTLALTGEHAACHVHRCNEGNATMEDVEELQQKSKESMERLMSKFDSLSNVTPYSLSDCVCTIVTKAMHLKQARGITFHDHVIAMFKFFVREIGVFDKRLASKVFQKMQVSSSDDDSLFTKIYTFQGDLLFPRLKGQYKGPSPQVLVLMLIVGAALADERNMLSLKHCLNKEWLVPIVDPYQVHGIALEDLHPGTFVNPSMKETWYLSELHLVCNKTKIVCFFMKGSRMRVCFSL